MGGGEDVWCYGGNGEGWIVEAKEGDADGARDVQVSEASRELEWNVDGSIEGLETWKGEAGMGWWQGVE